MTRLNTQFQLKAFHYWIQWCSVQFSSVQFKKFLFSQVDDITGNEVSPTKQARGDSGKEPKLHRWQNGEKKPWAKPGSVGGPFLLWPDDPAVQFQLLQSQIVRAQLVPMVLSWWLSRWRGPHWGSVSGAHLGVLVSADVQGCRGRL